MRNTWRLIVFCVLVASSIARAADLNATYSPTRAEWLKQSLISGIHEQSNTWAKRLAVLVAVRAEENSVIITVTLANGESEPDAGAKKRYVQSVRSTARSVLDRFAWAKDVKLTVQFA
jgi:hypothetical protein